MSHLRLTAPRYAQGVLALSLNSDETLLAVHHAGGVDVHHVSRLMAGEREPLHALCGGETPRHFQWCVSDEGTFFSLRADNLSMQAACASRRLLHPL